MRTPSWVVGLLVLPSVVALPHSVPFLGVTGPPPSLSSYFPWITGKNVTVAILDTGVDVDHPTFRGAFLAGIDVSQPCPPSNPLVPVNPEDISCYLGVGTSTPPDDTDGHGTHVAGIVLGRGDEGGGHRGVAPEARLVSIKISTTLASAEVGGLSRGLRWVDQFNKGNTAFGTPTESERIRVVSVSFSSGSPGNPDSPLSRLLSDLASKGVVVVVPAGNCGPGGSAVSCARRGSNTIGDPGMACEAITVGAIDDHSSFDRSQATLSSFSSRGPGGAGFCSTNPKPDVVAPGVEIESARYESAPPPTGHASGWSSMSGTSQAVPHVAGVVALMLQVNSTLVPSDVKKILIETATMPDGKTRSSHDEGWGWGMVDGYAAVRRAMGGNRPPVPRISVVGANPQNIVVGETVIFDGSSSTDDVGIRSFEWTLGDGNRIVGPRIVNHTYSIPGNYTVRLRVVDVEGASAEAELPLRVYLSESAPQDKPPIADFVWTPKGGRVGERITFDASPSSDDHGIVSYEWDVEDNGVADGHERVLLWEGFLSAGFHPVRLTVTDTSGQKGTVVKSVQILEGSPSPPSPSPTPSIPPVVEIESPKDGETYPPGPLLLAWRVRDPDDGVRSVRILVDGSLVGTYEGSGSKVHTVEEGRYTFRVEAEDMSGKTSEKSVLFYVRVEPPPPSPSVPSETPTATLPPTSTPAAGWTSLLLALLLLRKKRAP